MAQFKENCKNAFRKRVDMWLSEPDHGVSYYKDNMADIAAKMLDMQDEEDIV